MSPEPHNQSTPSPGGAFGELRALWQQTPSRGVFLGLLAAWIALFHFLGNSTLGYVNTPSVFGWWWWVYTRVAQDVGGTIHSFSDFLKVFSTDEAYAWFIPFVVAGLLWWRREELIALPKKVWWPALGVLVAALLLHVLGYMAQQARLSLVAFFLGIFGFTGLLWGVGWMRLALFPFALFAFCVPLGSIADAITVPLRLLATRITAGVCQTLLGIDVVQSGTQLFDAGRSYQYEVAAACSGIRSLTAIVAFSVIYGYVTFKTASRRLAMIAAAVPLAVVANVFRLTLIVLAAEAFGQKAGNYVHESAWFSLTPYIPSIGGLLALGWLLREDRGAGKKVSPILLSGAEQKS
jgi:exosortase